MCSEGALARTADHASASHTLCVTNVQRFSLHDGGGIRTVVFCKGCPFRCPWCCNPEDLSFDPQITFNARLCIGCSVRADGRLAANGCACDMRPDACPTGAKEFVGTTRTVGDLVDEIMLDLPFYEESNGGVTISGGEALADPRRQRSVIELLILCKSRGISCAVESSLAMRIEKPESLAAVCDLLLVDFKIADRLTSRAVTGIDPDVRDINVSRLISLGARVVARMPIVPGYTAGFANVRANAEDARSLGIQQVDVLPFHQLGEGKYDALGLAYACRGMPQLSEADVADACEVCADAGLIVTVSGELNV